MQADTVSRALRFEEILAEPSSFWVRHAPRSWPGPDDEFLDIARGCLATRSFRAARPDAAPPMDWTDTVYLPLVRLSDESWRDELCRSILDRGAPVLIQLRPGEESPTGATPLYDLTAILLAGDLEAVTELEEGSTAAWPLIPGLTDAPGIWRPALEAMARSGIGAVRALVPEMTSAQRRRLAALGDSGTFEALFHQSPPQPLAFAAAAARLGLKPLPYRPGGSVGSGGRSGSNRVLATRLSSIAELWLLLGGAEGRGQAFFRAARGVERGVHDFVALAREGNLGVFDWLEEECRGEIEGWAGGDKRGLLEELHDRLKKEDVP